MAFTPPLWWARAMKPGDRVAIALRNLPEWPVCFYGAALAGAVATPLNAWWSARELAYGLRDSGARVAIFDARALRARARSARQDCGLNSPRCWSAAVAEGEALGAGQSTLEDVLGAPPAPGPACPPSRHRRSATVRARKKTPPCSTPPAPRAIRRAWRRATGRSPRRSWPPSTPRPAANVRRGEAVPEPDPARCRRPTWWPSPSSTSPAASRC